jgi:hypothetical protein
MRTAKLIVQAIRIECPFCATPVPNDEGDTPNECVCPEPHTHTCEDCGKRFAVPALNFGRIRPLRRRRLA